MRWWTEKTLMEMYRMATADKHGFLFVNLLNEREQMFYKGFDQRFVLSELNETAPRQAPSRLCQPSYALW